MASDPTYLEGGGGFRPPPQFSGRGAPNDDSTPKLLVSMWSTKKELGQLAKNWARGPNLKISEIGQSGQKIDFQEFLLGRTKIDIAR